MTFSVPVDPSPKWSVAGANVSEKFVENVTESGAAPLEGVAFIVAL